MMDFSDGTCNIQEDLENHAGHRKWDPTMAEVRLDITDHL